MPAQNAILAANLGYCFSYKITYAPPRPQNMHKAKYNSEEMKIMKLHQEMLESNYLKTELLDPL